MANKILLWDIDSPESRPLSRFRTIFSLRDGIFNNIERVRIKYPNSEIYFYHPVFEYSFLVGMVEGIIPIENIDDINENDYGLVIKSDNLTPFKLLDGINNRIETDLELLDNNMFNSRYDNVIGDVRNLYIHNNAVVMPNCVFDTRSGVIVVDQGTEISPFSYLTGPLYIGKNSRIDNARVTGGCIFGNQVRIGGEIENSIINDFSNKHHEGFLGHSILGSWVNLGALTTTSDLKNNYGEVRISIPTSFYPLNSELIQISTGTIKFGSIIGDCSKTAIGTMLNTGTVIDCGCNIFGNRPDKYTSPLSWGNENTKYEINRFISDCVKIFSRRKQTISSKLQNLVENLMTTQNI